MSKSSSYIKLPALMLAMPVINLFGVGILFGAL